MLELFEVQYTLVELREQVHVGGPHVRHADVARRYPVFFMAEATPVTVCRIRE